MGLRLSCVISVQNAATIVIDWHNQQNEFSSAVILSLA